MTIQTQAERSNLQIGDSASCTMTVTEQDVDAFAAWSSDDNALHMDTQFADQMGFSGRVAHGMVALAMISRLIGTQLPGHGSLWMSQELEFTEAVLMGTPLEARVVVEKISLAAQVVQLQTEVVNRTTGQPVLRGRAKVRVPDA